jgi:ATP-dependent protease ClpP protease subunit
MPEFRFWGHTDPRGREKIPLLASVPAGTSGGDETTLRLYEPIDSWGGDWGTSALEFMAVLDEVDTPRLRVHINSPGGEVYEAIAILNALRAHPGRVTAVVDGLAASAASFIAAGADELVMRRNTELMIHDAWGIAVGPAATMRELGDRLDHLSDNIASIYAAKASGTVEDFRAAMLAETWYSAEEAVAVGLADGVDDGNGGQQPGNRWDLSAFKAQRREDAAAPVLPSIAERAARSAALARHAAAGGRFYRTN